MACVKLPLAQKQLIDEVIATYNSIGEDFDATRRTMWPEFVALKEAINAKLQNTKNKKQTKNTKIQNAGTLRVLDSGCGNGRLAHYLSDLPLDYYAFDGSKTLIAQAKKWWKKVEDSQLRAHFSVGNILTKKFATPFDVIISSAVIHHLPTPALQLKYLKHQNSMLADDGFVYVTAWNLWQPKYEDLIDPQTHGSQISWGKSGHTRFYYAFTKSELIALLGQAGFTTLEEIPSKHNFSFITWKK